MTIRSKSAPSDKRRGAMAELESTLGYAFRDRELLDRALTHASAGDGARKVANYEQLEFLGDRVLNLLAAERLMLLHPDAREGDLSKWMHALVSRDACAMVARTLGVPDALRLAGGESKRGGRDNPTILGDACEALLAALYCDAGLEKTAEIFARIWAEPFEQVAAAGAPNPKSELQEWAQARGMAAPRYEVVERSGPDHAPTFTVEVTQADQPPLRAVGRSRQEAEKAAAQAMLGRKGEA